MRDILSIFKVLLIKISFILVYIYYLCAGEKKQHIVLATNRNEKLVGNLEAVYKALKTLTDDSNIQILLKSSAFRTNLQVIKAMAQDKIIVIDDFFLPVYLIPKKWQRAHIIQLWHAVGDFKKVGRTLIGQSTGVNVLYDKIVRIHSNYDLMCVGSLVEKQMYLDSFYIQADQIIITGTPKTDVYFGQSYNSVKIDENIAIFAPTFRGESIKDEQLIKSFIESVPKKDDGFKWYISLHPYVLKNPVIRKFIDDYKYIKLIPPAEIEEYLIASQFLISDYSAIVLEYVALKKPIFFYIPDYKEYKISRGFYHNYVEEFSNQFVNENSNLKLMLKHYDYNNLKKIKKRLYTFEDGKSSIRVAQIVTTIFDFKK